MTFILLFEMKLSQLQQQIFYLTLLIVYRRCEAAIDITVYGISNNIFEL